MHDKWSKEKQQAQKSVHIIMPKKSTLQGLKKDPELSPGPLSRLNKLLAHAGCCSRRAADELIAAGRVCVNGAVAETGQQVHPLNDKITVDGKLIKLPAEEQHTYIMLHKPIHVVSTAKDPQNRQTVLDILPEEWKNSRLYPVGRLDYFSEGLLLLTDDGEITFRLTHPGWHIPRVYEVKVRGEVEERALQTIRAGMTLAEGETLAPAGVEATLEKNGDTILRLTLHQGVNRQIRRMCRDLGLTILYLRRVQMGPLHLGRLRKGEARPLADDELLALRQAVKLA